MIYDHPEDYPDHFIMRPQAVAEDGRISYALPEICDSLEEARSKIPPEAELTKHLEELCAVRFPIWRYLAVELDRRLSNGTRAETPKRRFQW